MERHRNELLFLKRISEMRDIDLVRAVFSALRGFDLKSVRENVVLQEDITVSQTGRDVVIVCANFVVFGTMTANEGSKPNLAAIAEIVGHGIWHWQGLEQPRTELKI
jgi:hypothetical protein